MEKTDEKIAEILGKLSKLADAHGDEALQLAVQVVRVDSIETIFLGAVLGLACAVTLRLAFRSVRIWKEIESEGGERWQRDQDLPYIFIAIICGVGSLITGLISVGHFAQYWAWTGIFDPKLVLAKRILERLL